MKIIKKNLSIGLLGLIVFACLFNVAFAFNPPTGINLPTTEFKTILTNALNWLIGIVALVAAFVIVIAGVIWATAGGDEEKQGKARKMLLAGVIGLAISIAAYAIVKVVTGLFT